MFWVFQLTMYFELSPTFLGWTDTFGDTPVLSTQSTEDPDQHLGMFSVCLWPFPPVFLKASLVSLKCLGILNKHLCKQTAALLDLPASAPFPKIRHLWKPGQQQIGKYLISEVQRFTLSIKIHEFSSDKMMFCKSSHVYAPVTHSLENNWSCTLELLRTMVQQFYSKAKQSSYFYFIKCCLTVICLKQKPKLEFSDRH